jgi:hypothetical protein
VHGDAVHADLDGVGPGHSRLALREVELDGLNVVEGGPGTLEDVRRTFRKPGYMNAEQLVNSDTE